MGGVLTHTAIGLAGFLIIYFISRKWLYGTVFFVGHLAPDSIRVAITIIARGIFNVNKLIYEPLFLNLEFTHSLIFWAIISAVIFAVIFALYKLKKMNKKQFRIWFVAEIIFIIGIISHHIADAIFFETNRWI